MTNMETYGEDYPPIIDEIQAAQEADFLGHTADGIFASIEEAWQEEYADGTHYTEMNDIDYHEGLSTFAHEVAGRVMRMATERQVASYKRQLTREAQAERALMASDKEEGS